MCMGVFKTLRETPLCQFDAPTIFVHYVTALFLTRRQNENATNCFPLGQDELGLIFLIRELLVAMT